MKTITFIFLVVSFTLPKLTLSQVLNDFESPTDIPIEIDSLNASNIWQIGEPSKTLFSSARSNPNALVTDTLNNYPVNDSSSFIVRIRSSDIWAGFPYIILCGIRKWIVNLAEMEEQLKSPTILQPTG